MSSANAKYVETKREKFGMSEITRRFQNGADGTVRQFYHDGKIKSERLPNGTERWLYPDGQICGEITKEGIERLYYENGALWKIDNPAAKHSIEYAKEGKINFEINDKDVYINPSYFSYYRIGIKASVCTNHWAENVTLNPHKKTLFCLGGDATTGAQIANGNINAALDALNFSGEECENMQLAACYRPKETSVLALALRKYGIDRNELKAAAYQREIQRVFEPFMAHRCGDKLQRLSDQELFKRFRNIMLFTHCAGADDMSLIENTLKRLMTELGYTAIAQKYALRQIICVTNNNQREFIKNKSDMTVLHRYSVWDGQRPYQYNSKISDDYGVFLEKYPPFHKFKGYVSGIINLRKNESLLIFDKVLKNDSNEHNVGFFTPESHLLTKVGKWQARLIQNIGRYWLYNEKSVPSANKIITQSVGDDTQLAQEVEKALHIGRQTLHAQMSLLENHFILSAAYEKFKHPHITAEATGVYKILSSKAR